MTSVLIPIPNVEVADASVGMTTMIAMEYAVSKYNVFDINYLKYYCLTIRLTR